MKASLDGVSGFKEILPVNIGDHYLLMAILHGIEPTIGILLQHREVGKVVLITVRIKSPKDSEAWLLIEKDKAAKVAIKGLNPRAGGNEVIGVAEIRELNFGEGFLQSDMRIQPGSPFARVDVDDARVFGRQIVHVDFRS